jgi:hypothetical protein
MTINGININYSIHIHDKVLTNYQVLEHIRTIIKLIMK